MNDCGTIRLRSTVLDPALRPNRLYDPAYCDSESLEPVTLAFYRPGMLAFYSEKKGKKDRIASTAFLAGHALRGHSGSVERRHGCSYSCRTPLWRAKASIRITFN